MDRPHARTLSTPDRFQDRHIGPGPADRDSMLKALGAASLEEMMDTAVPSSLRSKTPLTLPPALTEQDCLAELRSFADQNELWRSYLGMGYSGTAVPPAIQRNILENPGWYTQYTPYQAEISQGRLEALLIFQTMIADLSGLEVAGSSLLDEATAAAEAMTLCKRALGRRSADRNLFFADRNCHPQTLAVLETRAEALGIEVVVGDSASHSFGDDCFGALVQYPGSNGEIPDLSPIADRVHSAGALLCVATDLLALTMLEAPGALGADVVVGSAQRFGVPMGYGGPHAGFLAGREAHKRMLPGRIVGVSIDRNEKAALRLALATREQHIRREKATSNICTAQVLLAIMAGMYAVYHGPERLRAIASRVHDATSRLATALRGAGLEVVNRRYFDTLTLRVADASEIRTRAEAKAINLRYTEEEGDCLVGISLDETVRFEDLVDLAEVLGASPDALPEQSADSCKEEAQGIPPELQRKSPFLTHPVFDRYHSETELMRYLHHLQEKDLSLTSSMIPLGSCTMKLNAAAELVPLSWPEFANLHPFAPKEQAKGYATLIERLSSLLSKITGFAATSLQPNAGSQGEYSGLLVIRAWQRSRGQEQRKVCLIPSSAHGTNPASATQAGLEVHVVGCDRHGNIDVEDLRAKAKQFEESLAALMVTYPSTHGVFEESIREVCEIVHQHGGQVYMDGANMNAQVGYLSPGDLGADVCHLNLHKTFAIPHGGGGPGVGPICVAEHLVPFLPGHPMADCGGEMSISAISAAPYGSPLVLPISYAYIRMMGADGLRDATAYSILGANYIAKRLASDFPVLYSAKNGYVAHECILDLRPLEKESGVSVADVAKRLMDYGFHAPTMSFPVAGTLMVEPTESESLRELDRFIEAMKCIREEIQEIVDGKSDAKDNLLKNAPHSAKELCGNDWTHPYSRERAGFPTEASRRQKFWPPVARVNDVYGDRTLVSRCEEGLWG